MNSDGKRLKKKYTARGLCIATGEVSPELNPSRTARSVVINVKEGDISLDKIIEIQEHREELAFAMKVFIKWYIPRDKEKRIQIKIFQKELQQSIEDSTRHKRVSTNINSMTIAFNLYLEFLNDYGVISADERAELEKTAREVLLEVADSQTEGIEENNPITKFYDGLEELIDTNKICVIDYNTGKSIKGDDPKWRTVIYIDTESNLYYLPKQTIYNDINQFYSYKFPMGLSSLLKYLQEAGLLHMTDKSRKTVIRTNPITKEKIEVIALVIRNKENQELEEITQL